MTANEAIWTAATLLAPPTALAIAFALHDHRTNRRILVVNRTSATQDTNADSDRET